MKSEEVIDITKYDLIKDQQYLLGIVRAANTGIWNPELGAKDPERISHSSWLTCVNRVLRLYSIFPELVQQLSY